MITEGSTIGGKLPLTVYESIYEADDTTYDKEILSDIPNEPRLGLKFRELPYFIETGEVERIGVDFVARGGPNAAAVDVSMQSTATLPSTTSVANDAKGKGKSKTNDEQSRRGSALDESNQLSVEDEESMLCSCPSHFVY